MRSHSEYVEQGETQSHERIGNHFQEYPYGINSVKTKLSRRTQQKQLY